MGDESALPSQNQNVDDHPETGLGRRGGLDVTKVSIVDVNRYKLDVNKARIDVNKNRHIKSLNS